MKKILLVFFSVLLMSSCTKETDTLQCVTQCEVGILEFRLKNGPKLRIGESPIFYAEACAGDMAEMFISVENTSSNQNAWKINTTVYVKDARHIVIEIPANKALPGQYKTTARLAGGQTLECRFELF